jgi:putative heme iron utilization protein
MAENARELLMQADMAELKGMVEAIQNFVYGKVDVATHLLGEFHDGVNAITGTAAMIDEANAALLDKINLFEFTVANVAQGVIQGG